MNGHDRTLELAAAAIDFALTPDERATVDAHLRGCPACRRSAAGFATDAATIAILPPRTLDPVAADAILAALLRGPARVSVIRYLAIAALLALLAATSVVVGAEILRQFENPAELTVAPTETPSVTAFETARPSSQATALPTSSPSVNPAACVDGPTIADLAALGGAAAAACYGSGDLTVVGIIPQGDPGFEVCPGREPAWLSCNDGSYLTTGPADETTLFPYAHDGEPLVARPASGAAASAGSPIRGFFSRFTGHYRDPLSADCRATDATDEYYGDVEALRARCEQTFVVTSINVLAADAVPQPAVAAGWTLIAGPDAFGSPDATQLASITELGGRLYAVSAQIGDTSNFGLWTSSDGTGWEEIDTGAFQPTAVASDGTRLIALDASGSDSGASIDGRSWQPLGGMGSSAQPGSLLGAGTVVYAAGADGIDAAIWHLEGDTWERARLENGAGWLGAQDASPAHVYRVAPTTRGWMAVGEGPPDGGAGVRLARTWTSTDGLNWADEPVPNSAAASAHGAAGWPSTDVVVGSTIPGSGPAAWIRRGAAWETGTFNGATDPNEELTHLIAVGGQMTAVGYRDVPFEDDRPLSSVVWGSTDGANWWRLPVADLARGLVEDVFVTRTGRVLAVGREFQGSAMSDWESAHGPAVFELRPIGAGG